MSVILTSNKNISEKMKGGVGMTMSKRKKPGRDNTQTHIKIPIATPT